MNHWSFEGLYRAYLKARRGKRKSLGTIRYETNALEATHRLKEALTNRTYKMGAYYKFNVYEPKEREIMALPFRDRVVQHYLCDVILEPAMERHFIFDTYACRRGKGVHAGLNRLSDFMRRHYRVYGTQGWVLKADISRFFYSIDHDLLKAKLKRLIPDEEIFWLMNLIIDSTPGPGIPLGNQSSQWFANFYLSDLDHFIKEKLRVKMYLRYMDDFALIHPDKAYLQHCLKEITEFVENRLLLRLNQKTQIFPLKNGIDFLGFRSYLADNGKVVRKLRQDSKERMRRRLKQWARLKAKGRMPLEDMELSFRSWLGHAEHGDTYKLTQKMRELYLQVQKGGNHGQSH